MSTVEATHAPALGRYEVAVDGAPAGTLTYHVEGELVTLLHVGVDPVHRGVGVAGELVRFALDDLRERGLGALPECSYVAAWIRRNPDYVGLVPEDQRVAFGLPPGV